MFKKSFLAIIALVAIIGFIFTACDKDDDGGKKITAKVRAYNNNGTAPSMSVLNARSAMDITPMSADTAFTAYTDFYSQLGAKKADITPTKFIQAAAITAYSDMGGAANGAEMASVGNGVYDFAQGVTITLPDGIEGGFTVSALRFDVYNTSESQCVVEFEWPGGQADFDNHDARGLYGSGASWNVNKITMLLDNIQPDRAQSTFSISGTALKPLDCFAYGAGTRRLYNGETLLWNELMPNFNGWRWGNPETGIGREYHATIAVPFTPVHIPENATSITLNISLNLNNIISVYEGATNSADDDIYVLKNGWWNDLYLTATVQ